MDLPTTVEELEEHLATVRGFIREDEQALEEGHTMMRFFLLSNRKLEGRLERALVAARAREKPTA